MTVLEKPTENFHPLLKESIYYKKVDPDLDVFVFPKKDFHKKYATYAVNYGSIDNQFKTKSGERVSVPKGIAHFLEHKLFDKENGNVFDDFSELGGKPNAFTSFGQTAYLFNTTGNFYGCLELLLNFVHDPYFTEESVQKEQGIIQQEISMYKDNPDWVVMYNLLQGLYHNHPVKINIAGTEKEIAEITPDLLYKCHETFYHPSNMVLFVIGDVDPEEAFQNIENVMGRHTFEEQQIHKRSLPDEPESVFKAKVQDSMEISKPRMHLGFKDSIDRNEDPGVYTEIVTDLLLELLFGKSSELYQELYEERLVDSSFEFSYACGRGFGFTSIGGATTDPEQLKQKLEKGIQKIANEGINEQDFTRVKNKLLGDYFRGFNSLEFLGNVFLNMYFKNASIFDYSDVLRRISLEDVEKRLDEHLNTDNQTVSILSAENDFN